MSTDRRVEGEVYQSERRSGTFRSSFATSVVAATTAIDNRRRIDSQTTSTHLLRFLGLDQGWLTLLFQSFGISTDQPRETCSNGKEHDSIEYKIPKQIAFHCQWQELFVL